jgi:hypothetical protein
MEDRSVPALDDVTADRLLEGGVAPDDAPPGFQDVARTLGAAALMATAAPTQDAGTAVAAFLDAVPTRRTNRMKKWKIAAATLAGGLTLSTGLAAADILPAPAQDVASSALSHVGINVPDSNDDNSSKVSTEDQGQQDKAADETSDDSTDPATEQEHPDNHGSVVSGVAHDDSTQGAEHGAAVCAAASADECKAGEVHPDATEHPGTTEVHPNQGSDNAEDGAANSEHTSNAGSGAEHAGGGSTDSGSGSDNSGPGSGD